MFEGLWCCLKNSKFQHPPFLFTLWYIALLFVWIKDKINDTDSGSGSGSDNPPPPEAEEQK